MQQPPWRPTTKNVATHLLARTLGQNGVEQGDFNNFTKPTGDQVEAIITESVNLLNARFGEAAMTERLIDMARSLTALHAAVSVELSHFPEQVQQAMSPAAMLDKRFAEAMCDWDEAVTGKASGQQKIASMKVGTLYPGYATGTF